MHARLPHHLETHIGTSTYTLVRAATIDVPVHGMFSFVPCRVYSDDRMRFPRPTINLAGIIDPKRQSPSGATAKDRRPLGDVVAAWHAVVDQVRYAGLRLGVHFATPPQYDQMMPDQATTAADHATSRRVRRRRGC